MQPSAERHRRLAALAALAAAAVAAVLVFADPASLRSHRAAAPVAETPRPAAAGATTSLAGSWWKMEGDTQPSAGRHEPEALRVLGYRSGYEPAPVRSGVTTHDPRRAAAGVNLVASGHAPEAALIDMDGHVLHRWRSAAPASYRVAPQRNFWRRVELLDEGHLLAIFDPYGMIKLDRDSNLLWATDASDHLHHDLFVGADGLIHTLGRRYGRRPDLHERLTFALDTIVVLDPAGTPLRRTVILEAFENSPFASEMKRHIRASAAGATGDVWRISTPIPSRCWTVRWPTDSRCSSAATSSPARRTTTRFHHRPGCERGRLELVRSVAARSRAADHTRGTPPPVSQRRLSPRPLRRIAGTGVRLARPPAGVGLRGA